MKLLTLKLALTFIAATIVLTVYESNSCSAQNTKTSPTVEEIDGNAIESIELVEGESKKLNYQQPIPSFYLNHGEDKLVSIEFTSANSFVVTGEKIGSYAIYFYPTDLEQNTRTHKNLVVNVLPDMTRRRRAPLKGDKEQRKQEIDNLIDSLADLDRQTIGIHWNSNSSSFIPNLPGTPKHTQAITKLIELGEEAIPQLLDRMSDKAPTKLSIKPADYVMSRWYSNEYFEYDPENPYKKKHFEGDYQVKIGDVCFVLIGQIVNRSYHAVRYQPSGCMVVNSPVHTPELKQLAVADWQDIDEAKLKASLLKDLKSENPFRQESAIVRLNYYFPNLDDVSDADSEEITTN